MWLLVGVTGLGCLSILFLLGRRNEKAVRRDWELLLTPKGQRLYEAIEGRVQSEMALAELSYDEAFAVRELGSVDEAILLLEAGYKTIERFAPNMLRLLAAMATFSRMVSAMAPVRPLRPRDFHLAQIASLAYLNQVLHQFVLSTAERFRLRVYILGQSFGLAVRFLVASTRRIVGRRPEADKEWEQIQDVRQDLQTLTSESLESLRVLLTSLASERREQLLKQL